MADDLPLAATAAALATLPDISARRLARLVDAGIEESWTRVLAGHGHPKETTARAWQHFAMRADAGRLWQECAASGVRVLVRGHEGYPVALAEDHEAPRVLFARGAADVFDRPRVTIVGARRCTHSGRDNARDFGRALTDAGVAVVSGLALGIDGAAHEGAVASERAAPIGVVGSGLDVVYPRRHARLWQAVGERGCLLSEAPLRAEPAPWRFPSRNRILAALGHVVLVIEAHVASGTRHTVDAALARGVPVLAVPGPIRSAASAGTNQLLREGCAPACDVDDVLVALESECAGAVFERRRSVPDNRLRPDERGDAVLAAVDWRPTSTETIVIRTALTPIEVATALAHLEIDGWVKQHGGWWERSAG